MQQFYSICYKFKYPQIFGDIILPLLNLRYLLYIHIHNIIHDIQISFAFGIYLSAPCSFHSTFFQNFLMLIHAAVVHFTVSTCHAWFIYSVNGLNAWEPLHAAGMAKKKQNKTKKLLRKDPQPAGSVWRLSMHQHRDSLYGWGWGEQGSLE